MGTLLGAAGVVLVLTKKTLLVLSIQTGRAQWLKGERYHAEMRLGWS
jgi:hypothetical protein